MLIVCIQIPLPHVDERKNIAEEVDKDRRHAIDASIVRIMKSRKVLGHQQLVLECVEQLGRMFKVNHFFFFFFFWEFWSWFRMNHVFVQPDIKTIKKRIEDLITRDYMERDKENPNVYNYLAWSFVWNLDYPIGSGLVCRVA